MDNGELKTIRTIKREKEILLTSINKDYYRYFNDEYQHKQYMGQWKDIEEEKVPEEIKMVLNGMNKEEFEEKYNNMKYECLEMFTNVALPPRK